MIIVLGSVAATAAGFDAALLLSQQHVQRSRAEPGCLAHAVHRDTEQPLRLVFVERWADLQMLQTHMRVPESRGFIKALLPLLAQPPQMTVYEATPQALG